MTPAGAAEARRPADAGEPDLAILIAAGYRALTVTSTGDLEHVLARRARLVW